MLAQRLIALIETHADALTQTVLTDLAMDPRTRSLQLPQDELEARVFATYHSLGEWIGEANDDRLRAAYESWGAMRFRQEMSIGEVGYALILVKHHLRRFVRDHGLIEPAGDRLVSEFFDRAMYYLARGYEDEAARHDGHAEAVAGRRRGTRMAHERQSLYEC